MTKNTQPFTDYLQSVKEMLLEQYGGAIENMDQRKIIKCHDLNDSVQLCVQKLAVEYDLSATKDDYRIKTELIQHQNDFFRKIDYYNMTLDMGSPDPADPKVTKRVLTVMFASEY